MDTYIWLRLGLQVALICLFLGSFLASLGFLSLSRYLPLGISALAVIILITNIWWDSRVWKSGGTVAGGELSQTATIQASQVEDGGSGQRAPTSAKVHSEFLGADNSAATGGRSGRTFQDRGVAVELAVVWSSIIGYIALIGSVGIYIATTMFMVFYLRREANRSWPFIAISVAAILAGMYYLGTSLNLVWPVSLLGELL